MVTETNHCPNYNHRRTNPPVRSCPICGEIVNHTISIQPCQEEKHARAQRNRDKYCVDCGKQFSVEKQK